MRVNVSVQVTVEVTDAEALRLAERQAVAAPDAAAVDEAFLDAATHSIAASLPRLVGGSRTFDALGDALADVPGMRLVGVWVPESLVVEDEA